MNVHCSGGKHLVVFIFHETTKALSTTKERKERGKCVLSWNETKKKAVIKEVLGDFFFFN